MNAHPNVQNYHELSCTEIYYLIRTAKDRVISDILPFPAGKHSLKQGKFYAIEKNFYNRTVKSLRTGRSCRKIDAAVFKQFWNLSGLSLGHNQLEIIYERQKMMLTRRNWIYIETELAKRGGMAGAPDEHAEVSGKVALNFFAPLLVPCRYLLYISKLWSLIPQKCHMGRAFVRLKIFDCFWRPKCNRLIYMI